MMTPPAEVPNEPGWGAAKAPTSNHRETVGFGRFGFLKISGRSVTFGGVRLCVTRVPVGSGPVQLGVRKSPVCAA